MRSYYLGELPTTADGTLDLETVQSSDYLVKQGIEIAATTGLGQHLKEIGGMAASGAAIGAMAGPIGAIVGGIIGGIVGFLPWLADLLTGRCEFMVRGEGGVGCDEFPARVASAAQWVRVNPALAARMAPAELATKFGIYESQEEARHGMGPDAAALMKLPEAQELLRLIQVPMASALMTTVRSESFAGELSELPATFPALTNTDLQTIDAKVKPEGLSTPAKLALGAAAVSVAGVGWYAYSTNQGFVTAARALVRKIRF